MASNARENWLISGPNGAGKGTLLSLVSADNPQGYNQDFTYLGASEEVAKQSGISKRK